jgi:amidohydrolase
MEAWEEAGRLLPEVVAEIVAPYGVTAELQHTRGVPPVVNDASCVALLEQATRAELGDDAVVATEQSLGGEDFSWYLDHVPGALARLGTRTPGGPTYDLHRSDFVPDERAIAVGVRLLAAAALRGAADAAAGRDELPDAVAGSVGGAVPVADR